MMVKKRNTPSLLKSSLMRTHKHMKSNQVHAWVMIWRRKKEKRKVEKEPLPKLKCSDSAHVSIKNKSLKNRLNEKRREITKANIHTKRKKKYLVLLFGFTSFDIVLRLFSFLSMNFNCFSTKIKKNKKKEGGGEYI